MWVFSHKINWVEAPIYYVDMLVELGEFIKAFENMNPMTQSCSVKTVAFKATGSTGKIYSKDRKTGLPIEQYNLRYGNIRTQWRGYLNPDGTNCYVSHRLYPSFVNDMSLICRESIKARCEVMG